MTVETQFGKATRCFEFFGQLGPNTDIHWSQAKDEFVFTGGAWPVCTTVANTLYEYKPEDTVEKLESVAQELFTLLTLAGSNVEHYEQILGLRSKFTRAVTGTSSYDRFGGLQGLSEKYAERQKIVIQKLILDIDTKLDETLENLTALFSKNDSVLSAKPVDAPNLAPDSFTDSDWEARLEEKSKAVPPNYTKYFLYSITLIYNIAANTFGNGQYSWWNEVSYNEQETIYLGALPLIGSTRNDLSSLKEMGIQAVLSVVESFEIETKGLLGSPVTSEQWKEDEIKHLHISTPDFQPLHLDDINLGVEFLRWNAGNGRPVYVHCKAGKARSALIVICYLIKVHGLTFIQALNFIKERRPQMHLDEGKLNNAKQYEQWWKQTHQRV